MSSEVLEERIGSVGERAASIEGKIDTLVEAFGNFKVEHSRQMGQIEATLTGLGTELRGHTGEDDRRFTEQAREVRDRHRSQKEEIAEVRKLAETAKSKADAVRSGGLSRKQAGTAVGGAGIFGALFDRFIQWLVGGGGAA